MIKLENSKFQKKQVDRHSWRASGIVEHARVLGRRTPQLLAARLPFHLGCMPWWTVCETVRFFSRRFATSKLKNWFSFVRWVLGWFNPLTHPTANSATPTAMGCPSQLCDQVFMKIAYKIYIHKFQNLCLIFQNLMGGTGSGDNLDKMSERMNALSVENPSLPSPDHKGKFWWNYTTIQ